MIGNAYYRVHLHTYVNMYTHVQRVCMTLQASIMQIHMHEQRMRNILSRVLARKRMDSLFAIAMLLRNSLSSRDNRILSFAMSSFEGGVGEDRLHPKCDCSIKFMPFVSWLIINFVLKIAREPYARECR